jgi:hypothetical protein
MDHSQIAVHGFGRIKEIGACPGRIQSSRDLLGDISGFASATNCDSACALVHQIYDLEKRRIKAGGGKA